MKRGWALMLAAVLAACGSSAPSGSAPSSTSSPTTTAYEGSYLDAIYAGLAASTSAEPTDQTKSDLRCVAEAMVEVIGVARYEAAGVKHASLRDGDFEAPPRLAAALSRADRVELGARFQACGYVGLFVAEAVRDDAADVTAAEAAEIRCLSRGFEETAARPMIVGLMLRDMNAPDATRLAQLIVDCADDMRPLMQMILLLDSELNDQEWECAEPVVLQEASFVQMFATTQFLEIDASAKLTAQVAGTLSQCLTPEHRSDLLDP